jgi:hypothetical protein
MPAVLFGGIGSHQDSMGPLHGKPQLMQQLAYMSGMIMNPELLRNDPSDQRRGPDSGVQPISHRAAIQNIAQLFSLMRTQADRTAGSVTLEQTLDTVGFILSEPLGNFGSWGLENVGEFAAGTTLRV